MKSKIRIILITIIFMCLIILALLLNVKLDNTEKIANNTESNNVIIESDIEENNAPILYTDTSIHKLTSTSILLSLQDCVNTYNEYNFKGDGEAIYNIITADYIESNNINKGNIFEKFAKMSENRSFFAKNVYEKEISFDHMYRYYVYGDVYDSGYKKVESDLYVIDLDKYNLTFSMVPYGETNDSNYEKIINNLISKNSGNTTEVDFNNTESIEKNNYNSFEIKNGDNLTLAVLQDYFNYYYFLQNNDQQKAYNLLNDEYKSKRFKNEDDYYNYAEKNPTKNVDFAYIKLYNQDENNKKYIGIDSKGKYYIAIETSPMNYKIMLDSYTVIAQETADKYNKSSTAEKACMCLELVKEMINNKDFDTMYSHLNNSFKSKYFQSANDLKKYVESNYYENNGFKYYDMETNSDGTYTINTFVNNNGDLEDTVEVKFKVKLGENISDFEVSFNINQ